MEWPLSRADGLSFYTESTHFTQLEKAGGRRGSKQYSHPSVFFIHSRSSSKAVWHLWASPSHSGWVLSLFPPTLRQMASPIFDVAFLSSSKLRNTNQSWPSSLLPSDLLSIALWVAAGTKTNPLRQQAQPISSKLVKRSCGNFVELFCSLQCSKWVLSPAPTRQYWFCFVYPLFCECFALISF